ncbi:MAG: class I SAM-dependent methyltransferase [Alphaproteobacteria bacterium]|nr:class I SAM-dependent methyltransferase [Alphaproteobacteria bacterium]
MAVNEHNLAYWNRVTPIHAASSFYRTAEFRNGACVLDPVTRAALGEVGRKRLLHLQCHFGLDTLSIARLGASVTGLDFSPPAIGLARELAREAGLDARFFCADVLAPPASLGEFDIVFASWGAIYWIDDLEAWMRVASRALRPGGRFCLCEGHPALLMLDEATSDGPLTVRWPYSALEPQISVDVPDYADESTRSGRTEGYLHGLARILNAAIGAGLTIRAFDEGDRVPWKALSRLVKVDRDYWALPEGVPRIPLSFTLQAVRGA